MGRAARAVGMIQRFGSIPAAIEIMGNLKLTVNEENTRTSRYRKGILMPGEGRVGHLLHVRQREEDR
jgi:hypothetical protein